MRDTARIVCRRRRRVRGTSNHTDGIWEQGPKTHRIFSAPRRSIWPWSPARTCVKSCLQRNTGLSIPSAVKNGEQNQREELPPCKTRGQPVNRNTPPPKAERETPSQRWSRAPLFFFLGGGERLSSKIFFFFSPELRNLNVPPLLAFKALGLVGLGVLKLVVSRVCLFLFEHGAYVA